ncbi:KH domain-containing protein [Ammoniphilus sp. CFH 90114]|uniref:KH domain-containing protein n=1 Tax=Ammoniphilus sp. CFH 90114 TaxID=2493665 RepID=UPI00100F7763|nr:KH domain-containing protein [Ammoniphilus sp. CFH 90114]RXT15088.1 KH domain-containing protein [Ammoniphilus sp. CFH 90114]
MKPLIEVIAKALVDHPGEVRIKEVDKDRLTVFELSVHAEDMGKVIGKQGRVAKALRTVVNAAAVKENKRITIDIV